MPRVVVYALLGVVALVALLALAPWREPAPRRAPEGRGSLYDSEGRALGTPPTLARRPNFVVIVLDTVRADALEPSEDGPGMPFLRSLAKEGVAFDQASSNAPWTKPALSSLLTGLLPSHHGNVDSRRAPSLAAGVTTFAEVLSRTFGYETVAFMDTPLLGGTRGVLQGATRAESGFFLQAMDAFVGRWAGARDRNRPFLLVLHTYEAHEPYGARNHPWPPPPDEAFVGPPVSAEPKPWEVVRTFFLDRERRLALSAAMGRNFTRTLVQEMGDRFAADPQPELAAELRRAYREGTTWVDGLLRSAVARLATLGLLEDTVLVVTSDHGEGFGEHGQIGHGRQLYDELLRIPLVMRGPEPFTGGRRISASVGLVDVMPTLLEWAGIPPPGGIDGRSFLAELRDDGPGRPVVAEEVLSEDNTGRAIEATVASVRTTRWKWIITYDRIAGTIVEALHDLASDPGERTNVLPPPTERLDVGPEACEAIRGVRERVWRAAGSDQERVGTPYGASTATLRAEPSADCR